MTPLDPLWWLGWAGALCGGVIAHELTHAIVAWPLAEAVSIDWRRWETVVRYGPGPTYRPVLVAVAPLLVALTGALFYLGTVGVPESVGYALLVTSFFAVWGFAGGLEEYRGLDLDVQTSAPQNEQ